MTNEEIAVAIQNGETGLYPVLWNQVYRWVEIRAERYALWLQEYGRRIDPVDFKDDLIQSAYFAVVEAVGRFDPETGYKFLTYLEYPMRTAFRKTSGIRSSRRDALDMALYLDAPCGDDGEGDTFEDITADPCAITSLETAEESIWRNQLHDTLESALDALPIDQSRVLRMRYYEERTCASIAEDLGYTAAGVLDKEQRALKKLYDARFFNGLNEYVEKNTNYYQKVGLTQFKHTGLSTVETIVLRREKLAEKWLKKKLQEIRKEARAK